MDGWINLLLSLEDNINIYIYILILSSISYYFFCIRKIFIDIFDPLFLILLGSIFAMSTVIYMYWENLLDKNIYFINYLTTEIAFIIGLRIFALNKEKIFINTKREKSDLIANKMKIRLYYLYIILFFGLNGYFYLKYGIPLLDFESHVLAGVQNGFVTNLKYIIQPVLLFLWIDRFYKKGIILENLLVGLGIICVFILSGSKSSFLSLAASLFFYIMYLNKFNIKNKINVKKIYVYILSIAIIFTLIPLYILAKDGNIEQILILLINRLVGYGDIFAYFYGSNIGDIIIKNNSFYDLIIEPTAAVFRLIPRDGIHEAIGFQVLKEIYNTNDLLTGPNGRHNVLGLICFGLYGAPIYSFIIGMIISFYTRWCYKNIIGFNFFTYILYMVNYIPIISMPTDFTRVIQAIILNCLLNGCLMLSVYFFSKKF